MKKCALLAIMTLCSLPTFASDDAAKRQEALKALEQAARKTNIFELPSFRMKADVQFESKGKLMDGSYQLLWNGPEQWREDIQLPGYTEVWWKGNCLDSAKHSLLSDSYLQSARGAGVWG